MPTSPRSIKDNIFVKRRADVGIGPYELLFSVVVEATNPLLSHIFLWIPPE